MSASITKISQFSKQLIFKYPKNRIYLKFIMEPTNPHETFLIGRKSPINIRKGVEENLDSECIKSLGLPANATKRLMKLKLAELELDSQDRLADSMLKSSSSSGDESESGSHEVGQLESILREETDRYLDLKQTIDRDLREKPQRERDMLNNSREADFYKDKIDQVDIDMFETKLSELRLMAKEVLKKKNRLKELKESLSQFGDVEPSNEALKARIDDLNKKRLSLEMSFVG